MKTEFVCPQCQTPLDKHICSECKLDIHELFMKTDVSNEAVVEYLRSMGAYLSWETGALVIPTGPMAKTEIEIAPSPSRNQLMGLCTYICLHCNVAPSRLTAKILDQAVAYIFRHPTVLPQVHWAGNRPQLFWSPDQLFFPLVTDEPASRLIAVHEPDYWVRYTGVPLMPRDHNGLFETFLKSLLSLDEENQHVFRTWCYTQLITNQLIPGSWPSLLIASVRPEAGKSSTAGMLTHLFGGALSVHPDVLESEEDLARRLIDPAHRYILLDNIRTPDSRAFDSPTLARLITAQYLSVKRLYRSSGSVSTDNHYSFILTANQPLVTPELLSRFLVATLRFEATKDAGWTDQWYAQRITILEDLMWHAIQNWKQGPFTGPLPPTRFQAWARTVARTMQRAPMIIPRQSYMESPIEAALDYIWTATEDEVHPLAWVLQELRTNQGAVKRFTHQTELDECTLRQGLSLFHRRYEIVGDQVHRIGGLHGRSEDGVHITALTR